ncbi:MAG: adenylate/guanylate cyclase domain-containing protein [Cypionkella sp.]
MTEPRTQRRLAAILAADVVGYARLMQADEAATLSALKVRWRDVLSPGVAHHRGRVVKVMGDGVLVEFGSAVDAVECAVDLQSKFAEANAGLTEARRIALRIGINLGEVIVEGGDIYGDGVNIAARLEGIAAPGGICVSAKVFAEVKGKVELVFADAGQVALKNIALPLQVYNIAQAGQDRVSAPQPAQLPLGKPSIAVLAFQNMSGDPEQDYFADGVVDDIITALSRRTQLFVVARNSSFSYKGRAVDIKQVGRELGVRYVLEGSLRRAGDRLRITAQLIEAATGAHLWAERYDGVLADVFDLQDQITASVVGAILTTLEFAEIELSQRKAPSNLDAYDHYLRGYACHHQWTIEASVEALSQFRKAIKLDPSYAPAYAFAAQCYVMRKIVSSGSLSADDTAEAERLALKAVALAPADDIVMQLAASVIGYGVGDVRLGLLLGKRALELNPNSAQAWFIQSWNRLYAGQFDAAIEHCQRAMRLSPRDPLRFQMDVCVAHAHFTAGRPAEALVWAENAISKRSANPDALIVLVASLARLGREQEAEEAFAHYLKLDPLCNLRNLPKSMPFVHPEHLELWTVALRRSGAPE